MCMNIVGPSSSGTANKTCVFYGCSFKNQGKTCSSDVIFKIELFVKHPNGFDLQCLYNQAAGDKHVSCVSHVLLCAFHIDFHDRIKYATNHTLLHLHVI